MARQEYVYGYHLHTCKSCGHVWKHLDCHLAPEDRNVDAAHTCPMCHEPGNSRKTQFDRRWNKKLKQMKPVEPHEYPEYRRRRELAKNRTTV